MHKWKSAITILLMSVLMFIYQNCMELQDVEFYSEKCVSGQRLSIHLEGVQGDRYSGEVVAYSGNISALDNYNYYSSSAHPVEGPKPKDYNINVFFYENSEGLYLNFFANRDIGGDNNWVAFDINVEILGNTFNDAIVLSDDAGELIKTANGIYKGRFNYLLNSDGGVIGPINIMDNFEIKLRMLDSGNVTNARFYSANEDDFSLIDNDGSIISFSIASDGFLDCSKI